MQNSSVTKIVNAPRDILKYGPCSGFDIAIKTTAEAGIHEAGEVTVAADHLRGGSSSSITISSVANTAIIACCGRRYRLPRRADAAYNVIAAKARCTAQIALSRPQLTAMICNSSSDYLHPGSCRRRHAAGAGGRAQHVRQKLETEKRPAFARSGATPTMQ